jgi:hypothetical protein
MSPKHARPGIAHYGSDLLSHGRLEAMNRALGTSSLALLERADLKTPLGIDQEFEALWAWGVNPMMAAAIEVYHDCDGLAFPSHSRV